MIIRTTVIRDCCSYTLYRLCKNGSVVVTVELGVLVPYPEEGREARDHLRPSALQKIRGREGQGGSERERERGGLGREQEELRHVLQQIVPSVQKVRKLNVSHFFHTTWIAFCANNPFLSSASLGTCYTYLSPSLCGSFYLSDTAGVMMDVGFGYILALRGPSVCART